LENWRSWCKSVEILWPFSISRLTCWRMTTHYSRFGSRWEVQNWGWELSFVYPLRRKPVHVLRESAAAVLDGSNFPTLQLPAALFLGMSAGSVAEKSLFSTTGLVCNIRRSSLSPATLHKLIFLRDNLDFVKEQCSEQLLSSHWRDVTWRSAPFALRLLDVDYFFISDFESLRATWLGRLANSNNWHKTSACGLHYRHFIEWPYICYVV